VAGIRSSSGNHNFDRPGLAGRRHTLPVVRRRVPLVTGRLQSGPGADLGLCMMFCAVVLSLPTVLSMSTGEARVGLVLAATVVVSIGVRLLPWEHRDLGWLVAWPVLLLLAVVVMAVVAGGERLDTLSGLPVLAFFYVGLTQRRWTGVALLPLGLVAWAAAYGAWSHQLVLRLPITVGVWLILSETLAVLRGRLQQLTAELRGQAMEDSLTGLASRRVFDKRIMGLEAGDAVVFIDLDNFKRLNDQEGHIVGDAVLAEFGVVLNETVRSRDLAARYGGEEFVLVLVQADVAGASALLDRLREEWKSRQPLVTFSAGISIMGRADRSEAAVAEADRALYEAKALGRNTTVVARAQPTA
jgi:diguanylate cyclase (GGDEF)-like protein